MRKRLELGCKGHLIVGNSCRWHRHTQVGNYRISTIGDYYSVNYKKLDKGVPRSLALERDRVGSGAKDFFESQVFKTSRKREKQNDGCGCRRVIDWGGLECKRYPTAGKAQAGHERLVQKYLRKRK